MFRKIMILGLFYTLFGCGDGKPGIFSANGYHIGKKVWYKTSLGMSYQVHEVVGADPNTFTVRNLTNKITGEASGTYGMDQNSIFYAADKLEGADLASFEYVCGGYSKDKHAVYYMANRLSQDVEHFTAVNQQFVKDSRYVYFGGDVFSEDPAHFEGVGGAGSNYYKDRYKCWFDIYELKEVDPATFHYLGTKTAADARRVFHEMNEVEGADLKTYEILDHGFAKDVHHVYQKGLRIDGADPATFKVLNETYTLDNQHCYYDLTPLPGADPATFQVIDAFYTKDARQVYTGGKVIQGADPGTFRVLNSSAGCTCDAYRAYSMDQPIKGVNPKYFPANATCKSCDENGIQF